MKNYPEQEAKDPKALAISQIEKDS